MTVEACVTKLAYLFGRGLSTAEVRTAKGTDLRGELSSPKPGVSLSSSPAGSAHAGSEWQSMLDAMRL